MKDRRENTLDGVKLSQLRALVAVAKRENFGEAAVDLTVSQSAVSHAIATLENELGVILLARGRYGARLTPVGERITTYAQEILQLLETMNREANRAKGLEGGELRIACFRSVATHILPEIIADFQRNYPAIVLKLYEYRGDEKSLEEALGNGQADIGFTCTPPNPGYDRWELIADDYLVLFPPKVTVPDCITWADLASYPLILPPDDDYCAYLIRQHFQRLQQPLQPAYQIREDSTAVSMVIQGLGITIMARLAAEPLPPEVQVRLLPIPLVRVISLALLADALHTPPVFAFLEIVKRHYGLDDGLGKDSSNSSSLNSQGQLVQISAR